MRFPLTFLFAAAAIGLACGGTTSSPAPSAAQASSDLATAACDRMAKCEPSTLQEVYGDAATCKRVLSAEEQMGSTLPDIGYTPEDVEACANAVAVEDCNESFGTVPSACMWSGTVKTGGACATSAQCVAADLCTATSETCGTCVVLPQAGEPCPQGACATGLVCEFSSTGSQCVAWVPAGGACDGARPCSPELRCTSGQCVATLGAGASCGADSDCDNGQALYCGANATCTKITFATVGQPCGTVNGAQVLCNGTGVGVSCVSSPTANGSGTCLAPLADGQPCGDGGSGASCGAPSRCVNGVCAQPTLPVCSAVDGGH